MIDSVLPDTAHGGAIDLKRSRRRKPMLIDPAKVDRLPPHAIEAEQGVLASIFLSPNECMGEAVENLNTGAENFYDLRHRAIYETLLEMYDGKEPIDSITVQQRLRDRHQL